MTGWHDGPALGDGDVLATYGPHWRVFDAWTGEEIVFEPTKVCENTRGMVPSPRLTDAQRSRRDAFLSEQERLHRAAVERRRKRKRGGRR